MELIGKVLRLGGGLCALIGLIGGILGSFDYAIVIKGQALPVITWTGAIIGIVIGIALLALGIIAGKKAAAKKVQ